MYGNRLAVRNEGMIAKNLVTLEHRYEYGTKGDGYAKVGTDWSAVGRSIVYWLSKSVWLELDLPIVIELRVPIRPRWLCNIQLVEW